MRLRGFENVKSPDIDKINDESYDGSFEVSEHTELFRKIDEMEDNSKKYTHNQEQEKSLEELLKLGFPEILNTIDSLPLRRAISLVRTLKPEESARIEERLDFYELLLRGKITKPVTNYDNYNSDTGEYGTKSEAVESDIYAVRIGLLRDLKRSLMKGTPENAISRMVTSAVNAKTNHETGGVSLNNLSRNSYENFGVLNALYRKQRVILDSKPSSREMTDEEKEHKAILMAQDILIEASKYNNKCRGPGSPYTSSLEESIAWAQLGEGVKAQFSGMRNKIQGVDLHNIGRFIGKSGDGKYSREARRLHWILSNFDKLVSDDESVSFRENVTSFLATANKKEEAKENRSFDSEISRLGERLAKETSKILSLQLPTEERDLQLSKLNSDFEGATKSLRSDHEQKLSYLQNRNKNELLDDIQERQLHIQEKTERHKSLAQMALDLHWHFKGQNAYHIDFINSVPFGDIKRAYKLMKAGGSRIDVLAIAKTSEFLKDEDTRGDYSQAFHKAQEAITNENQARIQIWMDGGHNRSNQEKPKGKISQQISDFLSIENFNFDTFYADNYYLRDVIPGTIELPESFIVNLCNNLLSLDAGILQNIFLYTNLKDLYLSKSSPVFIELPRVALEKASLMILDSYQYQRAKVIIDFFDFKQSIRESIAKDIVSRQKNNFDLNVIILLLNDGYLSKSSPVFPKLKGVVEQKIYSSLRDPYGYDLNMIKKADELFDFGESIKTALLLKESQLNVTRVSAKDFDVINRVIGDKKDILKKDASDEFVEVLQESDELLHRELLKIFENAIPREDREALSDARENIEDVNRLLKIILDLDLNNGETRVTKFMQQSDTPDRIWVYFSRKLIQKKFLTSNLSKYLIGPSLPILRKLLAQSPMDFNTIIDTASSLGITNLAEDNETLFSAMRDIGGITPEVYKRYKALQGQERDDFVEKIKVLKSKFFGNTPIDQLGVDENIIKEILYLSYKPTNTSYAGVVDYLRRVPDCTSHLAPYTFPQNGYSVEMKDIEVTLRPNTKLRFNFSEFCSMLENQKAISEKDISQTLMWIAKGSTSPTMDQMALLMNFLPSEDRQRLVARIKEVETDKDMFAVLNSVVEFLGIFAKDNLPKALQEYMDKNEPLKDRLDFTLKQDKYSRLLKGKLGDDYGARSVDKNLSKLVIGLLQVEQQKAKKDIRNFLRPDGSIASESVNTYKIYLSKNKASFFAKASGGICTADNIDLFQMKNHLHFNIVRNDEVVLGNIQGYTHTDTTGKSVLILRGFNPSDSALKEFSAEAFVEAGLKVGREFVKENGLDTLAIVYDDSWHPLSNREQVRQYFASRYGNKGHSLSIPNLDISAKGKIISAVRSLPV